MAKRTSSKPGPGRRSIISPLIIGKIAGAVAAGTDKKAAGYLAGVGYSTLKDWIRKGEEAIADYDAADDPDATMHESDLLYVDLVFELRNAEAVDREILFRTLREYGTDNDPRVRGAAVRALMFVAERKYPDDFGQRMKVDGEVSAAPRTMNLEKFTDEELDTWQRLQQKAAGEPG